MKKERLIEIIAKLQVMENELFSEYYQVARIINKAKIALNEEIETATMFENGNFRVK